MINQNWKEISELPGIKRGKEADFWVAVLMERRDYTKGPEHYQQATECVIKLSYLNAELTDAELDYWEENGCIPDESPSDLDDWQNEDGEHSNYTGWISHDDDGRYYIIKPGENGYVPEGAFGGRFRMLAWLEIIRPDFPIQFNADDLDSSHE
ncbi:hypothetical protein KGP17_15440 [Serratia sp. JSRIV001]|uniref:hypothetical protein n=1 Tax=Serratia sp. JSRIV001 TaxID=2831893 RepID=UPI001CBC6034|nr:hypothetical protein [Serratia sp. JSRIV001]UAN43878.1 hypothetical protein KGP17_15440 [Serratia sp. JSRIV001]